VLGCAAAIWTHGEADLKPQTPSIVASLRSFWRDGSAVERGGYVAGAVLIISGLLHLTILGVSGAAWYGPVSLRKPMTFGLSFGLTLITVVWVTSFLPLRARARTLLLGVFTAACALETVLVTVQAWRGVPSHFNLETTFDGLVARTLAGGGFGLVAVIVVLTLMSFRPNAAVPVSLRIAIRIGFIALLVAVFVGALMIAKSMALVFAGDPQSAYATGGTLKPIHGVAMHAILVLPTLAWALTFADWTEQARIRAVLLATAGYVAIVGVVGVATVEHIEPECLPSLLITFAALGGAMLLAPAASAVMAFRRAKAGSKHDNAAM
jgi:hypothetical protein